MLNTDLHRQTPIKNILCIAMFLIVSLPLAAQAPAAIPIPAQLTTAQTAFVANAGGSDNYQSQNAYKSLYQALLNWKHFQLVTSPAQAELALELITVPRAGGLGAGLTVHPNVLQLNIRDVKTQSLLWSFTEPVNEAASPTAGEIATVASKLVADFKALISGEILNKPTPKRFSEEKK